jgi:LysM repeat protein
VWKWVVLFLALGLAALAAFWWRAPKEAVPPPPPVALPVDPDPTPVPEVPVTKPPPATEAVAARYREVLEAVRADNIDTALALIEQAQAADPQGVVLAREPELRAALVDGLAAAARRQFPFGDLELARRITGAHQALALDASQTRALLEVIDKLTVYRQVLPLQGDGDTEAALTGLEAARQADPAGVLLKDFPALRDQLFDGFLAAVDQEMPFDSLARLIDALTWLDPHRAAQVEALAESWGMEDIEPAAGPPPAAGADPAYHQVLSGDTLWDIAASHYGDPTRWPQIYGANRDRIRDPDLIYPGQRFAIPASDFPVPFSGGYQVRKGDSLWKIAARIYGDPTRWTQIHAANRDRIRNPDLIFPNQLFIIPQGDAGAQP